MKGHKIIKEFRAFALQGRVVHMAIGVVIGGAFGKIATALVNDLILPLFSVIIGRDDLSNLSFNVNLANGILVVRYGDFLQQLLYFILIAFAVFIVIKVMNALNKDILENAEAHAEELTEAHAKTNNDLIESISCMEKTLLDIHDLLKEERTK